MAGPQFKLHKCFVVDLFIIISRSQGRRSSLEFQHPTFCHFHTIDNYSSFNYNIRHCKTQAQPEAD